jgi:hypothetical protein
LGGTPHQVVQLEHAVQHRFEFQTEQWIHGPPCRSG